MLSFILSLVGFALITIAFADLINTLISTSTSPARWWPSNLIGRSLFSALRSIASRMPETSGARERMLAAFGPLLVIALLGTWAIFQVVGFALIWWELDDIASISGFGDALYYSGVVYFTVGFGEIVPTHLLPRAGALTEAFAGVVTMALVIGYLPSLYTAYSERERRLITLDAGNSERITPTHLLMAWAPDADPKKIDAQFEAWEEWAAGILETHSSLPMLALFRSHDRHQNWVTALGLLTDAALLAQFINGATDGNAFWFLRRAEAIFREMTQGDDLSAHQAALDDLYGEDQFRAAYDELADHGFNLREFEEAVAYARPVRRTYGAALEYMIDYFVCPRGFWAYESTLPSWSSQYEIARHDAE